VPLTSKNVFSSLEELISTPFTPDLRRYVS
jgi:hypothetical protein